MERSDQIEGTEATCDPRRAKGLVMVTHGHGEHPAVASLRRNLGEKYRTTPFVSALAGRLQPRSMPPLYAAGIAAAYEFRADSAKVADMLDQDASAADHMPPISRGKAPTTSVRLEAARLRAVRALGDDFRVRCAALGPKTFEHSATQRNDRIKRGPV